MNDELGIVFQLDYMNIFVDEQVRLINIDQFDDRRPCVGVSLFNPDYDIEKIKKIRSAFTTAVMFDKALFSLRDWFYFQHFLITLYDADYKLKVVSVYHESTFMVEEIETRPDENNQVRLYVNGGLWLPEEDIQRIPIEERTEPLG